MVEVSQWVKLQVQEQERRIETELRAKIQNLKLEYLPKIQTLQNALDESNQRTFLLEKALSNFVGKDRVESYIQSSLYSPSENLTL